MSKQAVAKIEAENIPVITQSESVLAVISRAATDTNVDVSKMERLLDMQMTVMAKQAETDFYAAMSELQSEMPSIKKEGQIVVKGQVRSRYARFEDILGQTRDLLKVHGFSVSFKSNFIDNQLEITGILNHKAGHKESTTMRLPFDDSGAKNKVQMIGSSVSYGKRYVYCMLLNINITEEDDDGAAGDPNNLPEKLFENLLHHNECLRDNLPSILAIKEAIDAGELSTAKECWGELEEPEQRALWVATTKGGILTTKERQIMKSNEWGTA